MGKIRETRELYKEVVSELSQSEENWLKFLDSSSWNFKYDFDDQILIYAQRPDAKACATMEEWNKKLKRWVNGGTKPIYIFDKNPYSEYPFKLVFDLSDTHNYNNTEYKLWKIKEEYEPEIIESLEASFGDIDSKETLAKAIIQASYNMVTDNMEDYLTSVMEHKANSMLADLSDDEIKSLFMTTVWASVSYMMMTRCGINAREEIQTQEFAYIKYFNNQELITTFGASVSDIAEMGLREIARTVANLQKSEKLKNRTIEKFDKEMYSKDNEKIKGGIENGRENRVHEAGGLLHAQPNNGEREDTSREVFSDEIQLSKESQKSRVDNSSNEQGIEETSNRSTGTSEQEGTTISGTNGEERWNNGRIESQESNGMGGLHEQLQDNGTRDSSERTDLHLEETSSQRRILTKEEQETDKDYLQDKYVSALLSNIQTLKVSRNDIKEFYKTHLDIKDRTEYIKQAFNDAYTEIVVDDVRLGYKTYENVLHLWKDDYLNRTAEVYYKWEMVAEYIEGLILVNEFNDLHKPLPSYDNQMQILQVEAENAPTFSFTQEIIDYALQGGSNVQESKMRIYHQFEESLSSKDNIQFLKNEYGWGGCSSIHIGTRIGIDYNGKGITLSRGYKDDDPKIVLPWHKVEKRISELIKADRYLNTKEKEEYSNWLKKQEQEEELRKSKEKLLEESKNKPFEERLYNFLYKEYDIFEIEDTENVEDNLNKIKEQLHDNNYVDGIIDYLKEVKRAEDTNVVLVEQIDYFVDELNKIKEDNKEQNIAERLHDFIKDFDLYSYIDNTEIYRSEADNIAIIKADINDTMNIRDYVKTLKSIIDEAQLDEENLKEAKELLSILQERLPKYEYHLGNTVYIGADEYEIAGINDDTITLFDPKFPLLNKQMGFEEFEQKVQENYSNDHLKVENRQEEKTVEKDNSELDKVEEKQNEIEDSINNDKEEQNEQKDTMEEKPYKVGQDVYLESDRKYRIDSIDLEKDKISLLDLQINYPIFREESILTFENLYYKNERNYPKEEVKPNFVKTSNKIQDFVLHPEVSINDRKNYKITDDNLGVGTPREKFERNIAAIKVLKKCEQENRYATPEEQEILSKYVGWGGLQQAFKEDDVSWANEYKTLKELLNDEEYKNARSSVLTAFYTPPIVINAMYEILQNMGLKEANILEPSCGVGNFFGMLPKELENCRMYGIELDSISGRIAQQLYQKSTIAVNAYEKVELPDSFFDIAVR